MIDAIAHLCYNKIAQTNTGRFTFLRQPVTNHISSDMGKAPPMCRTFHVPPVRLSNDRQST